MELLRLLEVEDRKHLTESLADFVRDAWPLIEPATPLIWNWHLDAICKHLQAVTEGKIKKLIINVPPGSGKSSLVSVLWPAWIWARDPHKRMLFASYKEALALRDSVRRRVVISSDWFQRYWSVAFRGDANEKREFHNSSFGYMAALGAGGSTGFRGDYLILDDPNDASQMESETQRASVLSWLDLQWSTRGNGVDAREVVIQQRTHTQDTTGHLLAQGGWTHLKIPMSGPGPATVIWSDPRSRPDELFFPEHFPVDRVAQLVRRLGPYGAAGQLQQEPTPAEGGIFKKQWLKTYRWAQSRVECPEAAFDPMAEYRFATVDPAVSTKDTGGADPDYFIIAAWCVFMSARGPLLFLLDVLRERLEGPDQVPKMQELHRRWRFALIGVETIAYQLALFQAASRAGLPVREIGYNSDALYRIDRDKVARAYAATPLVAGGRLYLPDGAPWLVEYLRELMLFPNAGHDDQVDATSAAVAIASKRGDLRELAEVYRPQRPEFEGDPLAETAPEDPAAGFKLQKP